MSWFAGPDVLSMAERPSVDVCSAVRAHRSPLEGTYWRLTLSLSVLAGENMPALSGCDVSLARPPVSSRTHNRNRSEGQVPRPTLSPLSPKTDDAPRFAALGVVIPASP